VCGRADAEDEVKTKAAVGVALAAMSEVTGGSSSADASPLASAYCVNGARLATLIMIITVAVVVV
jgi:hypothetical protein